jgi:hypothetical protein
VALDDGRLRFTDETEPTLPLVCVLVMPRGVVSSSVKPAAVVGPPRAEALRGPMLALRSRPPAGSFLLGSPAVPRTLCANFELVGLPNRAGPFGPGVAIDGLGVAESASLRTGESGLGNEVRGLLPVGLAARPGPTDWENLESEGVGGVKLVEFWLATLSPLDGIVVGVSGKELADAGGESRLCALLRGTKMPDPGTVVLK